MFRKYILAFICIFQCVCSFSQEIIKKDTVSCNIYFHQSKFYFDPQLKSNEKRLKEFVDDVYFRGNDPSMSIKRVLINSGASPEGPQQYNDYLSDNRADAIVTYLKEHISFNDSLIIVHSPGVDWEELIGLVKDSDQVPDKDAVLQLLTSDEFGDDDIARRKSIEKLNGGVSYRWMYDNLFPLVRHSKVRIAYVSRVAKEHMLPKVPMVPCGSLFTTPDNSETPILSELHHHSQGPKKFYMSLQTNMLYDIVAVPNIGLEFYLGKGFSIDTNWMYAWWHSDPANFYWRTYGGDIAARYWFGRKAKEKPLTGHHIGLYGQMLTYDVALGGRGQIGGIPKGTLWDKANFGAGLEYGYSLPIATRLNLDFNIGLGYFWGEYQEYIPQDNCYVWQSTKYRRWIGPTKAEISLVYLIGRYNFNRGKGGAR